ncbi:glycosyl hydrolase, family 31 [Ancylostoma duodenale]|uniref:Glycosyl hydrolase, family 31 n=1 Tax=Ancylostoma duodenale TaxID=51022 RepID=A0A0C2FWG7_9BILA|nr:glycosyl hydrolase, family 31 [Ancylostoma duodenale]
MGNFPKKGRIPAKEAGKAMRSNEVTTAPGPTLIYRTIGGNLDLYFFPGPTPEEVTRQYLNLIGRPYLPAYWTLGFQTFKLLQISRYGYKDLNEMIEKIERNIRAGIPVDTVVADIDYMDRYKDFTIGKYLIGKENSKTNCNSQNFAGLPEYVKRLHSMGMRTVFMFDPAIQVNYESFEAGIKMGAKFIEWERPDQVNRTIQVSTSSSSLYPYQAGHRELH